MITQKIFDWKGNEVKVGMTIYFVQQKPGVISSGRFGLLIPQTGEAIWEDEESWKKRKDEEVWELGEPLKVILREGRLCAVMKIQNNPDVEQITFPVSNMFDETPTIAIKGISDKKNTQ